MRIRPSLGSVQRGLIAAAVLADGGAALSAWNGTSSWHDAIYLIAGNTIALVGALIDPGTPPPAA